MTELHFWGAMYNGSKSVEEKVAPMMWEFARILVEIGLQPFMWRVQEKCICS